MSEILLELNLLFEQYKLFESRFDYLLKTYGKKLEASAKKDHWFMVNADEHYGRGDKGTEILFDKMILQDLEAIDPTTNKQYLQWLVLKYIAGNFKIEDNQRVTKSLENFTKYKNRLPQKDINQYKGVADIEDAIDPFLDKPASKRQEKELTKNESEKIYDDGNVLVVIPRTEAAACFYGKGTRWCTAADENNMFNEYAKDGDLVILIDKKNNRKYQFHLDSHQFMNARDEEIPFASIIEMYTKAGNFLLDYWGVTNSAKNAYNFSYLEHGNAVRIKRLDDIVSTDPLISVKYARNVVQGRFPEGEPAIATNAEYSYEYAAEILEGPFALGEKAISTDSKSSFYYAWRILHRRFPEGEKVIAEDSYRAFDYAKNIIKGPWPMGEKAIAINGPLSYEYARHILKGPFPEGVEAMKKDYHAYENYKKFLKFSEDFPQNFKNK